MGGTTLDRWLIAGAMARSMAMHAYSAIPDIEADKKAKLATVATYCGKQ
jgi:4-hydroxybenzoate polyprenyltransferase